MFGINTGLFNSKISILQITRSLMKTHKGTAKRWKFIKSLDTFKRGKSGRQHGNVGWSQRSLKHLSGRTYAHTTHVSRLRKLLPYN
ncbi:hypothetical protein Kpol_505p21 [Vanderwaltozyma polyspora DSM 70294]|uniref:50S ribosomal protein L35 n=1 Tax=Vanderwaltozyma polyspora (strain ATCC 22028 / DSM 70294 / BCRC 21397 / CBS 2163 / NBRC 10782 / NRRL Y-8283 / UCD 57-17) TaxID=436907 RepID=A7TNB2_VANPO|nr:uncharacterized protein Kpol_505p21 [Vanderwaltozyma polyspora DSM 70294]EDO16244.1 hypothetical protein Kpol_505p21 [Vanderwaltozyma polyspora DSM 70294]